MLVRVAEYPQSPKYNEAGETPRPSAVSVETADPINANALEIGLQINMPTKINTPQATSAWKYTWETPFKTALMHSTPSYSILTGRSYIAGFIAILGLRIPPFTGQ